MTAIRKLTFEDLFKFNRIVLDPLTEVYSLSFFITKILKFPMLSEVAVAPNEQLIGFLLACRTETNDENELEGTPILTSQGHVCSLSIDNEFRRLGLGTLLMKRLNAHLELQRDWYVDLYVRSKNQAALRFYKLLGYVKYNWLPDFYGDDDGYEMRLPLSRDINFLSLRDGDKGTEGFYSAGQQLLLLLTTGLARLRDALFDAF